VVNCQSKFQTSLGVDSKTNVPVYSNGTVFVRDRASAESVTTNDYVQAQSATTIPNQNQANLNYVTMPDFVKVTRPTYQLVPLTTAQSVPGIPGLTTQLLVPGSYDSLNVAAGASIALSSGVYYFNSLKFEPNTTLYLADANGPVTVYVRSELILRASTPQWARSTRLTNTFKVVYIGTSAVSIDRDYYGQFIAPFAPVSLTNGVVFTGQLIGASVTLHQDSHVYHERPVRDFGQPWSTTTFSSCGTYPSNAGNAHDDDVQGVTHDDNNWYFTNAKAEWSAAQCESDILLFGPLAYFTGGCDSDIEHTTVSHIWKVPVSADIAANAPVALNPWHGKLNHFGAITYVNGRVYVPIQPGDGATDKKGAVGALNTNLTPIGLVDGALGTESSWTDECTPDFSWIAYNPVDGLFYGPAAQSAGCMVVWQMVPQGLAGLLQPIRSVRFRDSLTGSRTYPGQQGGAFSPTGRLYLIDNNFIRIVDPLSGVVLSSVPFTPPGDDSVEGEGISVWDLSQVASKGPGVSGQLHFQRLVNKALTTDEYYLEHWCANDLSKL